MRRSTRTLFCLLFVLVFALTLIVPPLASSGKTEQNMSTQLRSMMGCPPTISTAGNVALMIGNESVHLGGPQTRTGIDSVRVCEARWFSQSSSAVTKAARTSEFKHLQLRRQLIHRIITKKSPFHSKMDRIESFS
jgi:hypothetical protein